MTAWQAKIINQRRIGFVAEHGSRDRPVQEGK